MNPAPKPPRKQKKPRNRLVRVSVLKRSPLKHKRGAPKRFAKKRNPEYVAWIRSLPCICKGKRGLPGIGVIGLMDGQEHVCDGPVEVMHIRSRGAAGNDVANTVPGCRVSHNSQHLIGIKSWAARWFPGGLDELKRIAAEIYPSQYAKAVALGWSSE